MYEKEIDRIDLKYPDIMIMETGTEGMYVLYDDNRDSVAITGQDGMVRLSLRQLKELLKIGDDILELMKCRA